MITVRARVARVVSATIRVQHGQAPRRTHNTRLYQEYGRHQFSVSDRRGDEPVPVSPGPPLRALIRKHCEDAAANKKQESRNVSLLGIDGNVRTSGLTPRAYHKQWEIRNPLGTGQRRTQSTCWSWLHHEHVMPARLARSCSALRGGGALETGPSIFGHVMVTDTVDTCDMMVARPAATTLIESLPAPAHRAPGLR